MVRWLNAASWLLVAALLVGSLIVWLLVPEHMVAMGLTVVALAGVVQTQWSLYLAVAVCLIGIVGLVAYSFIEWRDDPDRRSAA